jgi:hypothetical protein
MSDPEPAFVVLSTDYVQFFPDRHHVQSGIKVWRTRPEAWEFLDSLGILGCSVYEVLLPNGWDHDVVFERGDHRLRLDVKFTKE